MHMLWKMQFQNLLHRAQCKKKNILPKPLKSLGSDLIDEEN